MKFVALGEIMLRLSTPNNLRIEQSNSLDVYFGGAEANTTVCLSHFGHTTFFVSKVPDNQIGNYSIKSLKKESVNTDFVKQGGNRLGLYFSENGSNYRPSKVIYDRKNSSIAEAEIAEFDFESIFKGKDWFHFSGITPAISHKSAQLVLEACKAAKSYGLTISCDLNFRSKLWSEEKAQSIMIPLMKYVDVCIGNEEDAMKCLGINLKEEKFNSVDIHKYEEIMIEMNKKFKFRYLAFTLRESHNASNNDWQALLYDGKDFFHSKKYNISPIVDRVGAGDSFSAGLIHGLSEYNNLQKALDFGVACSALKHTIPGDFNYCSEEEVLSLLNGNTTGRVER